MTGLTPPTVAADRHTDVEALKPALGCFPSGVVARSARARTTVTRSASR